MPRKAQAKKRVELGKFIVADPAICHGKPTFKGTRIMVWQILDAVTAGHSWDYICNTQWGGRIPILAIAEAVRLCREAFLDEDGRLRDRDKTEGHRAAA